STTSSRAALRARARSRSTWSSTTTPTPRSPRSSRRSTRCETSFPRARCPRRSTCRGARPRHRLHRVEQRSGREHDHGPPGPQLRPQRRGRPGHLEDRQGAKPASLGRAAPDDRRAGGRDHGIDYIESSSAPGASTITVHLVLSYDPNAAVAQVISKIDKVRNQLPSGALPPTIDVQVGETTAAMYLSFASDQLDSNQITDYLTRVVQPKLASISGVQSAQILGARVFAMRIWLKSDRLAAYGLSPAQVSAALAANNALAAVGATKGSFISVNLNAATDLHTADE